MSDIKIIDCPYCPKGYSKNWRAKIHIDKKTVYIGEYKTENEAHGAYMTAFNKQVAIERQG